MRVAKDRRVLGGVRAALTQIDHIHRHHRHAVSRQARGEARLREGARVRAFHQAARGAGRRMQAEQVSHNRIFKERERENRRLALLQRSEQVMVNAEQRKHQVNEQRRASASPAPERVEQAAKKLEKAAR